MAQAYRADIDGLRAIAVSVVVLFHAGLPGISGGFIGVDVFFVISGYLITGILFRELSDTGKISLIGFYARRFARIVPSLVLVIGVTAIAGAALLSSSLFEVHALAKSAIAALLFVPNLYFYGITSTYFAANSAELPLLHTWSLGVEEQYYLVWPLLLMAAGTGAARGEKLRRRCLIAIVAVGVASIVYCAALGVSSPSLAFYNPLSRFWELGVGSALAIVEMRPRGHAGGRILAFAGLAMIAAGAFAAREGGGSFPFPLALLPVIGTAAIIAGNGMAPDNQVARLLSLRPMVAVGKVSYAWYLWHWPPLAFAHLLYLGEAPALVRALTVPATLLIAFVTVALYENPLRHRARELPERRAFALGLATILAAIGLSSAIYAAARVGLLPEDPRIKTAFNDRPPMQQACLQQGPGSGPAQPPAPACLAPQGRPRVIVWGDSHADQWVPAVAAWAAAQDIAVEQLTRGDCPPTLGLVPFSDGGAPDSACAAFNRNALERIAATRDPVIVVLAANWLSRAAPPADGASPPWFDTGAHTSAESLAALQRGMDSTLAELGRRNIPAILLLQSPFHSRLPAACVMRLGADQCGLDRARFNADTAPLDGVLRGAAARQDDTAILDPAAILCTARECPPELDGRIAYFDRAHVAAAVAASPRAAAVWRPVLDRAWAARQR